MPDDERIRELLAQGSEVTQHLKGAAIRSHEALDVAVGAMVRAGTAPTMAEAQEEVLRGLREVTAKLRPRP